MIPAILAGCALLLPLIIAWSMVDGVKRLRNWWRSNCDACRLERQSGHGAALTPHNHSGRALRRAGAVEIRFGRPVDITNRYPSAKLTGKKRKPVPFVRQKHIENVVTMEDRR